ncbi:MAG: hypothetical protein QOI86_2377 [Actinomycetota bacterium]|nr:hypothetical protein [Actinomycetota bacterium]
MPQADDDEQEVIEFLNELRVVLPGVQVLFAFLLTVPFSARFGQLRPIDRDVYFAALLLAAGSSAMLMAPSVHARLNWRHQDKRRLIALSNPLAITGSGLLAAGIACSIYLIADVLYRSTAAAVTGALVTAVILGTWFAIPLCDRRRHPSGVRPRRSA